MKVKMKVEVIIDVDISKLIGNMDLPIDERILKSVTKIKSAKVGLYTPEKDNILEGVDIKNILTSRKLHAL
jgi:hypothetical protein